MLFNLAGDAPAIQQRGVPHALAQLGAGVLQAAPAPWYYWQHPTQPSPVCAQLAPGPGWEQISAPFAGPGCQRPLRARMP